LTGFRTGFFGVGGGFIVVPMLWIALGLAMRRASGTSLLVMVIATAASLLARIGTEVQIDWVTTLVFAAGSAAGGMLGGPLSARARPSTLTLAFSALLGGVAAVTLVQTLTGPPAPIGTSLLVMVIATAASLLARIGTEVQIDWVTTLVFAAGSAAGGMLGGPLSARARPSTLTLAFSALLGGVAAVTLVQTLTG